MIPVTRTFFPPIEDYRLQLERIWKNQWLTNRGELVKELESSLKAFLEVPNIILTTNGTLPLQIAVKALAKEGEIITTPFSYVATVSAIIWENCTPVFVDIDPDYLTINEREIESAITERTTAILATHVFGNPCNVEVIEKIARRNNLAVIYDAAHSFGVKYIGKSLFNFGDISTCSFHATKLFHTGEGGAIFCSDENLNHKLFYSHNFGHKGPIDFYGLGINAKMSELQAAMGLSVLPFITHIVKSRKEVVQYYDDHIDFSRCRRLKIREGTEWNYSYYPIILESNATLMQVLEELAKADIFPRRYFFPSLNTLGHVLPVQKMPVSESIASKILCLPLFCGLPESDARTIVNLINSKI